MQVMYDSIEAIWNGITTKVVASRGENVVRVNNILRKRRVHNKLACKVCVIIHVLGKEVEERQSMQDCGTYKDLCNVTCVPQNNHFEQPGGYVAFMAYNHEDKDCADVIIPATTASGLGCLNSGIEPH